MLKNKQNQANPNKIHKSIRLMKTDQTQIDSSTIDGNLEFVHSVQLYSYDTSVNSFMCPKHLLIIVKIFE